MASGGESPHVVVVGGGYSGTVLAMALQKQKIRFTLIDPKNAMHHNVAAVRAAILPGFAKKTLIPYEPTFGTNFKQGRVTGVRPDQKEVELEGGETVKYDILVLATGTSGPFPCKLPDNPVGDLAGQYENSAEKVKASKRIVLIGGGAVGVEIAAEIATEYPDKEVTLIHPRSSLVREQLSESFQKRLLQILDKLNVKIITGERVNNMESLGDLEGGTVNTTKGQSIVADLVIKCTGLTVNSSAYKDGLGASLSQTGALTVNQYLQVEQHDDIFAMGDCSANGNPWMALHAGGDAELVAKNIKKKLKGSPLAAHKPERADRGGMIVVALGRNNAIGQTAGGTRIPEFLLKKLKSSDLMVKRFWKQMKQKPPA